MQYPVIVANIDIYIALSYCFWLDLPTISAVVKYYFDAWINSRKSEHIGGIITLIRFSFCHGKLENILFYRYGTIFFLPWKSGFGGVFRGEKKISLLVGFAYNSSNGVLDSSFLLQIEFNCLHFCISMLTVFIWLDQLKICAIYGKHKQIKINRTCVRR